MSIINDIINPKPIKVFMKINEKKNGKGLETFVDEKALTDLDISYLIQIISFLDAGKMLVLKDLEKREIYLQQPQEQETKQ